MRFAGCAARVYDVHSLRLAGSDGQVCVADSSKKSSIFLLEAVFVALFFRTTCPALTIAAARALHAEGHFVIQQNRQIGLQVATKDFVQLQHRLRAEFASSALWGSGGRGEVIAEHDAPLGGGGKNNFVASRRTGSEQEPLFVKWR